MFQHQTTDLFNIKLIMLNSVKRTLLQPVTDLRIFVSSSSNFDDAGLFSTTIFGPVGSDHRNSSFGYMDLHVGVLHPLIFKQLGSLRAFYTDILSGKKYATFNPTTRDFDLSNATEGSTGYEFFITHLPKLRLEDRDSDSRRDAIQLIQQHQTDNLLLSKWLVLPAGMRDYYVDDAGAPKEDEINDLYRKLLATTKMLENFKLSPTTISNVNIIRYRIQLIIGEIYTYISTLLDGKNKFIQDKFAKRAIVNGTRNVLTPALPIIKDLHDPANVTSTQSLVGLYQYTNAIAPITIHHINNSYISRIFDPNTSSALLVNPKTNRSGLVEVNAKEKQKWLSAEGLSDIIGGMGQDELRDKPIMVANHYLQLIHDHRNVITIIDNTETMDEGLDKKYLKPITYYQLLYLAVLPVIDKYPALINRYPILNLGSIYPSKLYVRTTVTGRRATVKRAGFPDLDAREYPTAGDVYYNAMSVDGSHLATLGLDYDGDMMNLTVMYTDESIAEIDNMLKSKEFYLSPNGGLTYNPTSDVLEYVVKTLSKEIISA